jgi:hypothetical protein
MMMKGYLSGCSSAAQRTRASDANRALGASAEADDLKALDVVVLECARHLVEEIREIGREVMRQVGEAEAPKGLGRCAADFGVVYETLML